MRILDIGAGTSNIAASMFSEMEGAEIVRLDIDPDTNPDIVSNATHLPDDCGMFDAMVASHVLEHMDRFDALDALKSWYEHLMPRGKIWIIVPDIYWAAEQIVQESDSNIWFMAIFGASNRSEYLTHKSGYTVGVLRNFVSNAGFIVLEARVAPLAIRIEGSDEAETAQQILLVATRPEPL